MAVSLYHPGAFDYDVRRGAIFVLISISAHLLVLVIMVATPPWTSHRTFYPSVIKVDLVAAVPGPTATSVAAPAPTPVAKPVTPAPVIKTPQKTVSISKNKDPQTTFKTKRSMKKKTIKSSKVVDSAVDEVKKKVAADQARAYEDTLQRLAREVEQNRRAPAGPVGAVGSGIGGDKVMGQLEIYKTEIIFHIQKNWSFSEQLAGAETNLAALLAIKIMPNGEIRDIWFDQRSGNNYLDESARKALLKSNPLPPLPKGFTGPFLEQGLRFTPSGVQ